MLSCTLPFQGEEIKDTFAAILEKNLEFPDEIWKDVSSDCKDLIKQLLIKDPTKRITIKEALNHPWFKPFDKHIRAV